MAHKLPFSLGATAHLGTTIKPIDVDRLGLLPSITQALEALDVRLLYNKRIKDYKGFRMHFKEANTIQEISSNYSFVWFLNLIDDYGDKTSLDTIILCNKTGINLLGLNPPNPVMSKIIFPMLNDGINRLTISSDHLATLQYINGHKTATIAEPSIAPSTGVKFQSRNWKKEWFFYSIAPHPTTQKSTLQIPQH